MIKMAERDLQISYSIAMDSINSPETKEPFENFNRKLILSEFYKVNF